PITVHVDEGELVRRAGVGRAAAHGGDYLGVGVTAGREGLRREPDGGRAGELLVDARPAAEARAGPPVQLDAVVADFHVHRSRVERVVDEHAGETGGAGRPEVPDAVVLARQPTGAGGAGRPELLAVDRGRGTDVVLLVVGCCRADVDGAVGPDR